MAPDPEVPLPRPPEDPERLRRLREEALARVKDEEEHTSPAVVVYGGPPAPVYGGPPGPPVKRPWTRRGLLLAIVAAIAAIIAWIVGRWMSAPVYGGPPVTVYGGPPPQPVRRPPPDVAPPQNPPEPPHRQHQHTPPPPKPRPPAPVYGGPPQ